MKSKALITLTLSSAVLISAAPGDQTNNEYENSQKIQDPNFRQTPRTIMDDEIAKNIHSILEGNWLTHGYPDVTFDVHNGTVNLRGVVDTREEKVKIENAVKSQEGVKGVHSEISVGLNVSPAKKPLALNSRNDSMTTSPYSTTPSSSSSSTASSTATNTTTKDSAITDKDRAINTKIRERLSKWSPKGYETIVIATSNGVVTITGNVDRVEDIQKISHDAKYTEGVKSVTNQISVKKR